MNKYSINRKNIQSDKWRIIVNEVVFFNVDDDFDGNHEYVSNLSKVKS